MEQQELIDRIKRLPPDHLAEVADFVELLIRQKRDQEESDLHKALTEYATKHAGTAADYDLALEAVTIDHLLNQNSQQ